MQGKMSEVSNIAPSNSKDVVATVSAPPVSQVGGMSLGSEVVLAESGQSGSVR